MEVINFLVQSGILDAAVVIGIIGTMTKMRKDFLDKQLEKVLKAWIKFLILAGISLVFSIILTALVHAVKFNWLEWLKMSGLNFIFSYVLHDIIKNLFFKEV
jgi:hypothetical protein